MKTGEDMMEGWGFVGRTLPLGEILQFAQKSEELKVGDGNKLTVRRNQTNIL